MGVTGRLSVGITRHDDGCIILEITYTDRLLNIEGYRRYRSPLLTQEILSLVVAWMDAVETGDALAEELEELLELPFG